MPVTHMRDLSRLPVAFGFGWLYPTICEKYKSSTDNPLEVTREEWKVTCDKCLEKMRGDSK